MLFRYSETFKTSLEETLHYYAEIDEGIAASILLELESLEEFLGSYPEATPLTNTKSVRKHLLKKVPYRVRYSYENGEILFLTLHHMSRDVQQ